MGTEALAKLTQSTDMVNVTRAALRLFKNHRGKHLFEFMVIRLLSRSRCGWTPKLASS